jgi:hypothetical protein
MINQSMKPRALEVLFGILFIMSGIQIAGWSFVRLLTRVLGG